MKTRQKLIDLIQHDTARVMAQINTEGKPQKTVVSPMLDITTEEKFPQRYSDAVNELRQRIKREFFQPIVIDLKGIMTADNKYAYLQAQVAGGQKVLM